MTHPTPTGEEVKAFWKYMCGRYRLRVINKKRAWEMRVVARFLDLIGIVKKKRFMRRYCVIIGRRLYVPFEVGDPGGPPMEHQISTIVHECQHVEQKRRTRRFCSKYLFSSAKRAQFEADAYGTNIEMHYWYTGKILSPSALANLLRHYGCGSGDVRIAERTLDVTARTVKKGGISHRASQVGIEWLEAHMKKHHRKGAPAAAKYYAETAS